MLRSMFTAIGGLKNHQVRMDVVANNIANVNTIGFKKGRVNFQDILNQTLSGGAIPSTSVGGINPKQVGLGMSLGAIDNLFTQGNLQTTGVNTDMALQGNGMFMITDNASVRFTRAGSFTLDANGDLVDTATGWHVLGWTSVGGVITPTPGTEGNINVPIGTNLAPNATTTVDFTGNLDATTAIGGTYTASALFYDSLGAQHTLIMTFTKTAANTWGLGVTWPAADTNIIGAAVTGGSMPLNFNGAGQLIAAETAAIQITYLPAYGALTPQNYNLTFGTANVTQYAADNTLIPNTQDGYASGTLTSYAVSDSGIIRGVYSNGLNQDLAQLAIAHFNNYGGLFKEGSNMWSETGNSGTPQIGTAQTGGRGSVTAGTLEMSNVDLAEEFTTMITAQRGFQANSRSITTSDEMLQELLNLKR